MLSIQLFFLLWSFGSSARAYIPAQPTNSSEAAVNGGLNITDISKLHLQWYANGSYLDNVSYQLAGAESNGLSRGVLVHFSEASTSEDTPPTDTPWIAMVSCDANATNASMQVDVFTLARDKGARSALLYSSYSLACIINPEYADPDNFEHVLDIFSTQSNTSAHLIEGEFGEQVQGNVTVYSTYDSNLLNNSASVINSSLAAGFPTAPGFVYASLRAYNATGDLSGPGGTGSTNTPNASSTSSSPNTALAMIVLYAITGCVSALFCIVIISGAIRAIRHPERYGPRNRVGEDGSPLQSRARGLTRAILDTFPVVKFGVSPTTEDGEVVKDVEAQTLADTEMQSRNGHPDGRDSVGEPIIMEYHTDQIENRGSDMEANGVPSTSMNDAIPRVSSNLDRNAYLGTEQSGIAGCSSGKTKVELVPEAIGTETCPICIIDFEDGDDLRILPCEGRHRFHQQCVDPWLLELSSSCPICRHDFHALETMMNHDSDDEIHEHRLSTRFSQATLSNRFSRYLRFARRRRSRLRREMEQDTATVEPSPMSPDHDT
ncbi:hypothetical protein JOM56_002239 [Amanita muscaria]